MNTCRALANTIRWRTTLKQQQTGATVNRTQEHVPMPAQLARASRSWTSGHPARSKHTNHRRTKVWLEISTCNAARQPSWPARLAAANPARYFGSQCLVREGVEIGLA